MMGPVSTPEKEIKSQGSLEKSDQRPESKKKKGERRGTIVPKERKKSRCRRGEVHRQDGGCFSVVPLVGRETGELVGLKKKLGGCRLLDE